MYIVLLQNNYLLFFKQKPKKKGNYLQNVKLYKTADTTTCLEINEWASKKYRHANITEVTDWE